MNSFVQMDSQELLQLCQMARHVIVLRYNIVRKEHERVVRDWDSASKLDRLLGRVLVPSDYVLPGAESIKQHKLSTIQIIETACNSSETVYLSFEDLLFLKDHEKV
jgi:hypothetical protein